jgi:predicted permease
MAFLDDAVRDVRRAVRSLTRAPLSTVTIVLTIALGLGLVGVAFTILSALLFRVDAVPAVHEMVAVGRPPGKGGERVLFTRAQFDALYRETSVLSGAYAEVSQVDSLLDGQLTWGTFVTGNFFQVLRVNAAMGRALTPADDESSSGPPVMVLSHRGWDRLFARNPAVLGRRLIINGLAWEIVGVMPETFRGLAVAPDDYWAPLAMLGRVRTIPPGGEAAVGVDIVGRLKPGVQRQKARAALAVWDATRSDRSAVERGPSNITLVPKDGTVQASPEIVALFAPPSFAFGLILLIGCANVANLLLARGVARQREIGVQMSLGATRTRIVRQLLTESLLLALAAAAVGFLISRLVLVVLVRSLITSMSDLGDVRLWIPDADWRVMLFLAIGAGAATIGFGLAPALQATRVEPVRMMRGELFRDARPGRARDALIGVQVGASALLLICAMVFLRSATAGAVFDSGIRTSDTIAVRIPNEPAREVIVQAVTDEPSVAAVAASWPDAPLPVVAEIGGVKAEVAYALVSPEYFDALGIPLLRGRPFTDTERTSVLSVAIVSETAARSLWPTGDAVGQVVRLDGPPLETRTFSVVGVVRDVAGFRIAPFEKAVIYLPTSAAAPGTHLVARVHGDPELARRTLVTRLTSIDPEMGRQVQALRTLARMDVSLLRIAFWFTVVLGGLALALTLSGLFSVLSYLIEQRTREIGVRVALGATARDVTWLIVAQSFWPVGIGLLTGTASAAGLAMLLLATPAAATIGAIVHVLDPVAYAASLSIIIVACLLAASLPAGRAARLDPTRALRQE